MTAPVFEGDGRLVVKSVDRPRIRRPDDVVLRVEAAGICGTDLQILAVPQRYPGRPNTILGHEYCGEVVEVGPEVVHVEPGDRVVVDPNITCGVCVYCRQGLPNMCERIVALGVQLNGGFAEYNVAPARAVHKIDKNVPPEKGIFAEPISCILNATSRVPTVPGMRVVIFGAGPIGQLFIQYYKAAGAGFILVFEPSEYRAGAALAGGADEVINPNLVDPVVEVRRHIGIGADIVVDAVGRLLGKAIECARKGGKILAIGLDETAVASIPQFALTLSEKTIIGTFIANLTFLPAIRILEASLFDLDKLITHRIPLASIRDGIELMKGGKCLKVVVET
ncbi:MAG: alcohol dehydrogenase catalytic domain-containing protein [Firmicutes bacterium]|nr:alcohol dehydrogenase catalytic domain-containing protein [Bacillota bacterium]